MTNTETPFIRPATSALDYARMLYAICPCASHARDCDALLPSNR